MPVSALVSFSPLLSVFVCGAVIQTCIWSRVKELHEDKVSAMNTSECYSIKMFCFILKLLPLLRILYFPFPLKKIKEKTKQKNDVAVWKGHWDSFHIESM